MSKVEEYRRQLAETQDWETFLAKESRLPGPRGNLELAQAVAIAGDEALYRRLVAVNPEQAPTNTPGEFLVVCGVVGLGRLLSEGRVDLLPLIRGLADDPRWRVREGVAMALQWWGSRDMDALLVAMEAWARGSLLERRAAVAALCEPRLLSNPAHVAGTLRILDAITTSVVEAEDRRSDEFRALRQGLGYCWSVAVAASPALGKPMMERWLTVEDTDVRWVLRENLRKNRLVRMDLEWVRSGTARLAATREESLPGGR